MEEPLQSHSDATAAKEVAGGCGPLPALLVSSRPGLQPPMLWHSLGLLPRWELVPKQRSCTASSCFSLHCTWPSLPPNYL